MWLNLANPDIESPFKWNPTEDLMELVAKRRKRLPKSKKEYVSAVDEETFAAIFDAALPGDMMLQAGHALLVLEFLGLVRYTRSGDQVPTQALRELVADRRRLDERDWRFEEKTYFDEST